MAHRVFRALALCLLGLPAPAESQAGGVEMVAAARAGDVEQVARELDAGVPIDFLPPDGHHMRLTGLEVAARFGHREVVELYLSRGSELRRDQHRCLYAASFAADHDDLRMMELIWRHAEPVEDPTPLFGCALVEAAREGHAALAHWLIDRGIDPDFHTRGDAYPRRAIFGAVARPESSLARMLVEAGADPDPPLPKRAIPPLQTALSRGDFEFAEFLLERGADPTRESDAGNGITILACRWLSGNPEAQRAARDWVERLIELGVDVNVSDQNRTPRRCAIQNRDAELAAMLEAAGGVDRLTWRARIVRVMYGVAMLLGAGH